MRGGVVSWAFIVLQGEWVRLRMRVALLVLILGAIFGMAIALSLGDDYYNDAADRCAAPFPELQETWEIDHPECAGRP